MTRTIALRIRLTAVALVLGLTAFAAHAQEQTWLLKSKNADIHEVVAQVAEITGKTFVIDPRLKGNVTVISNTPLNKEGVYALFLSVLRVHNFTATQSGDVVRIQQTNTAKQTPGADGKLQAIAPEELVTRVIAAQNVDSAELVKILRPLIPQYGHIAPVAQPNVVIISDHAENVVRLEKLIRQIDISDEEEVILVPLKDAFVGTLVPLLEQVAPDQIGRNAKGPQRIQIFASEGNNSLVIRGKPRPVGEILKLIDKLDKPTTIAGDTRVIRLNHADAVALAETLTNIASGGAGGEGAPVQETQIHADESLNALVIRADPAEMGKIIDLVEQLDVRRTQVLIEAAIAEVTITDNKALGVDLAAVDARGRSVPFLNTALGGTLNALLGNLANADGDVVNPIPALASATGPTLAAAKIDTDGISFGAVVTALAENTDTDLLSTPSILTLDNQEARIVVGTEVPFRTGSFTTTGDGANNPFTTVNREDVGLQLTVTPHSHDGSSVRLEVEQLVTNVVDNTLIGDSGFADIVTSKRELTTTILAEDAQTIVLGGLIQDDVNEAERKVPLLGDIPGVGNLFKSRTKNRTKTNLLVFLRPTVLKTEQDATAATKRKYSDIWEVEINSTPEQAIDGLFQGERLAEPR